MKKGLIKLLCVSIVGASILSFNCVAYASSEVITNEYTKTCNVSSDYLKWIYFPTLKQWGIGDKNQGLGNRWIYDNGKWYFINNTGKMVTDTVVYDPNDNYSNYYMQEDGTMLTNGYCTPRTGNGQVQWKAYADASGKLTLIQ